MRKAILLLFLTTLLFAQKDSTVGNSTQPIVINMAPEPRISISGDSIMKVDDKDGNLMVLVAKDGKVTYGKNYKADDGAKAFWEAMAKYFPEVCKPVVTEKK